MKQMNHACHEWCGVAEERLAGAWRGQLCAAALIDVVPSVALDKFANSACAGQGDGVTEGRKVPFLVQYFYLFPVLKNCGPSTRLLVALVTAPMPSPP